MTLPVKWGLSTKVSFAVGGGGGGKSRRFITALFGGGESEKGWVDRRRASRISRCTFLFRAFNGRLWI